MKVGVLALQGDVREHSAALDSCGATPVAIRLSDEIDSVDALVIPGGESTTIGKLLDRFSLLEPLRASIADGLPVYGTCAGLILLSRSVRGPHDAPHRLGSLDVTITRNAYGRQADSFESDLAIRGFDVPFRGVFIRAPVIEAVGDTVEVLAAVDDRPVLVREGHVLASSFHPELAGDPRVHALFLEMVR